RVNQPPAQVDVGEQAPVDIAPLDPEDEVDLAMFDQAMVEIRGAWPEALHRRVGLDRLRRVDADVANVLQTPVNARFDRVPVDGADDVGIRLSQPGVRCATFPRPQNQQRGGEEQHEAAQLTATPERTSHTCSRARAADLFPRDATATRQGLLEPNA